MRATRRAAGLARAVPAKEAVVDPVAEGLARVAAASVAVAAMAVRTAAVWSAAVWPAAV